MHILPPNLNPGWRASLAQRAHRPPLVPRLPLHAGSVQIGSVVPALIERLNERGWPAESLGLSFHDDSSGANWRLEGDPTQALERLAFALRDVGLIPHWHDERLAVQDAAGLCIGAVERGATRLLGMAVHCVHLVGFVPAMGTWVQQRSLNKAEAPGLWDTLVGGTVAFGERPESALQRELWEEAGLHTSDLLSRQFRGSVRVAHPTSPDDGLSYSVDIIDCHLAEMAADVTPLNQDGEVICFERWSPPVLGERLVCDDFTLEAACVLLQVQHGS